MTDQATTAAAKRREYWREYRRKHKAKFAAYLREYREAHKAEIAAYQREYRKTRKERESEEARRIRRERKTPGGRPTREDMRMLDCQRTVPLRDITRAKVKPAGVSDIRWRMELSRRRMAAKERGDGGKGDLAFLPHPDWLW